jgi:hypothetical protein
MDNNNWYIHGSIADYEVSLRDGQYYIRYCVEKIKNGQFQPLISERDPEKEALRIAGTFLLKQGLIAVVIGAGCLKLIELLKKQQAENGGDILVFEADHELYAALKKIMPALYNDMVVVTDKNVNDLNEFVGSCTLEQMLGYRFIPHARSYQLAPQVYKEMEDQFKSLFSIRFSDLLTRIEFEARWILNGLLNLSSFIKGIPVKALFNQAGGENALLVSSGPSLRESLPWIKKNQSRYFIACADSAWRVLHRSGITPHLVFTLDAQIFTLKHFQGLPQGKRGEFPVLYADFVGNPVVVRSWKGNIVMGVTAHYTDTHRDVTPGCDYIEEEFLQEPCGDLQSGGSVATSLFDLLRNMNFTTITLVGQDLAFTNREIHSTGTHHTDIWLSKNVNRFDSLENINNRVLKKRHIVWGTSIKGARLPEDYIFSIYRKWFEESIATVPIKVMNASCDGAVIKGVQPVTTPEIDLSKKCIANLSKILFQTTYKTVKDGRLKIFLHRVMNRKSKNETHNFEDMKFMERVGKKYYIKHLRAQMRKSNEDPVDTRFLQMMKREKIMFWNLLQKRIEKYYTFTI